MAIIQHDCASRVLRGGLGTGRVGFCVRRWLLVLFGPGINHNVLQLVLGRGLLLFNTRIYVGSECYPEYRLLR
jgi:hypothetical protein